MTTNVKLSIGAAMALIAAALIWWGLKCANPWALAAFGVVWLIVGLTIGANNKGRVDEITNKIPPIR